MFKLTFYGLGWCLEDGDGLFCCRLACLKSKPVNFYARQGEMVWVLDNKALK